jgi:hypothetical protein
MKKFTANLYEFYQAAAGYDPFAKAALRTVDETMEKFGVPKEQYSMVGNLVLRMSHWRMQGGTATIPPVDLSSDKSKGLHALVDMYTEFNNRIGKS